MNETKTTSLKKNHNFKKMVKGVLWFCKNMPEKNPENPTELLGWKVSLIEMGNGALNTLFHKSIDNHLTTKENGMTLNF